MNLGYDPSTTVHGKAYAREEGGPRVVTANLWQDPAPEVCAVCHRPVLDGFCGCLINEGDGAHDDPRLNYTEDTQKRIGKAIDKARQSTRRAHLLGHNSRFDCDVYSVYSSQSDRVTYTLKVYAHPTPNAYAYLPPYGYILCDCQAGGGGAPCYHAAKVALRIQREAKRAGTLTAPAPALVVQPEPVAAEPAAVEPAAKRVRNYMLEDLFDFA